MTSLAGKTVVLGICGSIASYKAADVASKLVPPGVHGPPRGLADGPTAMPFIT